MRHLTTIFVSLHIMLLQQSSASQILESQTLDDADASGFAFGSILYCIALGTDPVILLSDFDFFYYHIKKYKHLLITRGITKGSHHKMNQIKIYIFCLICERKEWILNLLPCETENIKIPKRFKT